jgi:putative drug exporter of the RND superfamily
MLNQVSNYLSHMQGVIMAAPPRLTGDGGTALLDVRYCVAATFFQGNAAIDAPTSARALA